MVVLGLETGLVPPFIHFGWRLLIMNVNRVPQKEKQKRGWNWDRSEASSFPAMVRARLNMMLGCDVLVFCKNRKNDSFLTKVHRW